MRYLRLGVAGVATLQESGRNCMDLPNISSLPVSKELSRDDASDSNSYNYNISFPRNNKKSEKWISLSTWAHIYYPHCMAAPHVAAAARSAPSAQALCGEP